jgi:hypothetical protein
MKALMPRHIASVLSLAAVLGLFEAPPASAQDGADGLLPVVAFAVVETAALETRPVVPPSVRPAPLVGLYASFATLQALDIASTRMALRTGAVEANPLVAPFARSPLGMTLVKAGVAGAMIYASERLWKTHRKAALLTMIGLNLAYGTAVAHNYRVAGGR